MSEKLSISPLMGYAQTVTGRLKPLSTPWEYNVHGVVQLVTKRMEAPLRIREIATIDNDDHFVIVNTPFGRIAFMPGTGQHPELEGIDHLGMAILAETAKRSEVAANLRMRDNQYAHAVHVDDDTNKANFIRRMGHLSAVYNHLAADTSDRADVQVRLASLFRERPGLDRRDSAHVVARFVQKQRQPTPATCPIQLALLGALDATVRGEIGTMLEEATAAETVQRFRRASQFLELLGENCRVERNSQDKLGLWISYAMQNVQTLELSGQRWTMLFRKALTEIGEVDWNLDMALGFTQKHTDLTRHGNELVFISREARRRVVRNQAREPDTQVRTPTAMTWDLE